MPQFKCSNCGGTFNGVPKFCPHCGSMLTNADTQPSESVEPSLNADNNEVHVFEPENVIENKPEAEEKPQGKTPEQEYLEKNNGQLKLPGGYVLNFGPMPAQEEAKPEPVQEEVKHKEEESAVNIKKDDSREKEIDALLREKREEEEKEKKELKTQKVFVIVGFSLAMLAVVLLGMIYVDIYFLKDLDAMIRVIALPSLSVLAWITAGIANIFVSKGDDVKGAIKVLKIFGKIFAIIALWVAVLATISSAFIATAYFASQWISTFIDLDFKAIIEEFLATGQVTIA